VGEAKLPNLAAPGVLAIQVPDAIVSESGPYVCTNNTDEDALFYSAGKVTVLEPDDSLVLSHPGTLAIETDSGFALSSGGSKQLLWRYLFGDDNKIQPGAGNSDTFSIAIEVDQPQPRFFRILKQGSAFRLHRRASE